MSDEVKKLVEKLLEQGGQAAIDEVTKQAYEQRAELLKEAGQVASDTINFAEQLAADGNPQRREIADIITRSILGGLTQVASGRVEPQEARVPNAENPFSEKSGDSLPGSNNSIRALESSSPNAGTNGQLDTPRGKGGRPKGSKNRAKPPQPGT